MELEWFGKALGDELRAGQRRDVVIEGRPRCSSWVQINIWTRFPLSVFVAFEEGLIKRPTRGIPVLSTSYRPDDSGRNNLKPPQMLSIPSAAVLIAPGAVGGHTRAAARRGLMWAC